ncbi:MAG: hypothetical protein U0998_12495 [Moraxellaceae bacterium]|nr:hypothetical protein [Moraxellaceae bacterium]MDP1776071.1 hypothetical protein [Moraxellaceae bacterium]MDZ4387988.1 hypothetical protein [Moraxellaceae bacterium]
MLEREPPPSNFKPLAKFLLFLLAVTLSIAGASLLIGLAIAD